ncbi:DegT/DnrJ/EryC1/StrS family aminotransferase [Acinetobacter baumannii]|nr:DegT/DnrJ/EryC1/StrS family aminotransferase [Acinetobacter baumannii]
MKEYCSLKDPLGSIGGEKLKFQAEPLLGGTFGDKEKKVLLNSFNHSCNIDIGFNASKEVIKLEELVCEIYNVKYAVALNGANTALDLVFKYLNLSSEDEVISAGANFHGQHLSILNTKSKLILAEINEHDFCISADSVRKLLTKYTKVIVVTDIHGGVANYKELKDVVDNSGIEFINKPIIIADAARSIGSSKITDILKYVDIIIFSLQSKKLISALGEGGIVATNDFNLTQTLREFRSFGMSVGWGSNFKISKLQAAVAVAQLENINSIVELRREKAFNRVNYIDKLKGVCKVVLGDSESHTFLYFPILLDKSFTRTERDYFMTLMAERFSVGSVVANPPTYLYNPWIREKLKDLNCPESELLSDRLFCLSFHHHYSTLEENYILNSMENLLTTMAERTYVNL